MSYQQPYGQPPQQQQYAYAPPPGGHPQHHQPQQHAQIAQPPPATTVAPTQSDSGSFNGGSYTITHRDTNAVLSVTLQQGANVRSKSGAMIHMSGSVQLTGKVKFSMKKLFTGGDMSESTYVGPGRVALGPTRFGDIITLHIDGRQQWTIGKDAFLACTPDVLRETKSQGFGKAMFSGESLFVYNVLGQGILWLTSFGAVDRIDVSCYSICPGMKTLLTLWKASTWGAAHCRQWPPSGLELRL